MSALSRRGRGYRSPKGGDDEWHTRPEFVEAARQVLGGIDLDPASNDVAQETVKATRYFTIEDDGLGQPWAGRVFMNPPFGRGKGKCKDFCAKLVHEYEAGVVDAAVVVVNGYSAETKWFRPFRDYPICFGPRSAFYHPDKPGNPMAWPAFVYLGPDPDAFVRVFSRLGHCVQDATRSDRTVFGRMMLNDEWELLRQEEEQLFGAPEMPERDFVTKGVGWSPARLDEEWGLLRLEEERVGRRKAERGAAT